MALCLFCPHMNHWSSIVDPSVRSLAEHGNCFRGIITFTGYLQSRLRDVSELSVMKDGGLFQVEGLARHPRYGAGVQVREYTSIWDAIQSILAKEGWRGLYKGTLPSVVKAAPAAAVTFVVYEAVIKWLTSLPVWSFLPFTMKVLKRANFSALERGVLKHLILGSWHFMSFKSFGHGIWPWVLLHYLLGWEVSEAQEKYQLCSSSSLSGGRYYNLC